MVAIIFISFNAPKRFSLAGSAAPRCQPTFAPLSSEG
jgi:hypothetical protein